MRKAGDSRLNIYGIFGDPLAQTASPAIQNCAFDHYRLKSIYFALKRSPARFRYLMRNLKSLALDGFNVTVPYKETVIPYLDRLSPAAARVSAVNTVKKEGNRWVGYNTDIDGFLGGLRQAHFQPKGQSAVILGAGGGARAVVFALAKSGAEKISIANRTPERAKKIAKKLGEMFPKTECISVALNPNALREALSEADLLVNTTKVGLKRKDRSLVPPRSFPKRKILVYDLIYQPPRTLLLQIAKRLGHRTANGESMLLYQGAKAFEIWTGRPAPLRKMRQALHDAVYSR